MSNLNINYEGIYQKYYEEIHQNMKYLFEQAKRKSIIIKLLFISKF